MIFNATVVLVYIFECYKELKHHNKNKKIFVFTYVIGLNAPSRDALLKQSKRHLQKLCSHVIASPLPHGGLTYPLSKHTFEEP